MQPPRESLTAAVLALVALVLLVLAGAGWLLGWSTAPYLLIAACVVYLRAKVANLEGRLRVAGRLIGKLLDDRPERIP
jgi:hypothetical protein